MKSYTFLNEHFELGSPLKFMTITQGFGLNLVSFYKRLGMLGHNGLDLRASIGTQTFACFDGEVTSSRVDSTGGEEVRYVSNIVEIHGTEYKLEVIHYHLSERKVKVGDKVKKGDLVALTGNSGKYTTAPHLHLGVKPLFRKKGTNSWKKDYTNGYRGSIDPMPFLTEAKFDQMPVDLRYDIEQNWYAEYLLRFKNKWLHKQFYKQLNRHPLSITNQEINALIYGGWDFETVFLNPAMYVVWTRQTKADYLAKKPFPKPFDRNPWKI